MKKCYFVSYFFASLFFLLFAPCWGQTGNSGFESGNLTGWTDDNSGTESVQSLVVRTGLYAGNYNTSNATNQRWRNDGNVVNVPSNSYVHFLVWVNPDAANSISAGINLGGNNSGGTSSPRALNTWTRLTHTRQNSSPGTLTAWGYVNTNNNGSGTQLNNRIDDGIIYVSTSSAIDVASPTTASSFTNGTITSNSVGFTWTNGTDAGTGIQNTIILRTTNLAAANPVLNDQGVYSTTGGAAGPNIVSSDWSVISTSVSSSTTTYTDNSVSSSTSYKYAVVHRDMAYNYSAALVSNTITTAAANQAPVITSNGGGATASINIPENTVAVTTVTATDDASTPTFSLNGGADEAKFSINATTGELTFITAPDYENPTDADMNNTYIIVVRASDGTLTDDQTITVTVTDVNEAANSSITDYFRTRQSGNWEDASTWESSSDNSTWISATLSPTSASNAIEIRNSHIVTIAANVAIDQTTVSSGGSLVVNPNTYIIVNDGTGDDLVISSGGSMTIKSTSAGTGSIANSAGTVMGNVTIERYITARRAYRLLSPSVTTIGTIRDNWQEGGNNTAGYGTHITGSSSGVNGFDATPTGAPSLYTYQYGNPDSYQPINNTNANTLSATSGYLLFVRGDRTPSHISASSTTSSTTLRATGAIFNSDYNVALQGTGKFTLVANPYASAIDWNSIYSDASNTALENYYTYVDPNIGSGGGYVTVTNSGANNMGTAGNIHIQSGQAFFVKSAASGTPALTIKQSHKSTINNVNVFRTGTPEQLSIGLYYSEADGTRRIADGVNTLFNNNYSAAIDGNDAEEIANFNENLAIRKDGKMLSIEGRPLVEDAETIELQMARMKVQPYEFEFTPRFNAPGMEAFLRDKFLNTETAISLASKTVIPFTITNDAASQAADRFMVVFKQAGVLPVNMGEVKAYRKAEAVQVEWTTLTESSVDKFEVEKSIDGVSFTKAATVKAKGNSTTLSAYNWLDNAPVKGYNYYRIKTISSNTTAPEYSKVVRVSMDKATGGAITVYPNPVKGNVVSLQFTNVEKGAYSVVLSNDLGQQVYRSVVNHDGGSAIQKLTLPASLQKGIYQLQVIGADSKINQQLIKD
jgi:hypothetical protein